MARVLDQEPARLVHRPRVNAENLRLYDHPADKRSHYSKRTVDIEYRYDFTAWVG